MKKLKIMTVVGTRPEIIRLSATIKLLDKYTNQIFVHTGQNYDYELNEIFFEDLGLRKPDRFMNVDVTSLGASIGDIFKKTEEIITEEKPDAMLVLGDTNSCLSAYMAKRKHIPIFHMESGNRSYDLNVPEEINRKIIDHIADINMVYTEHARRHLISEGLPHRRIYLTGSPMYEVLQENMDKIKHSSILNSLGLNKKKYFVVSVHREENVDYNSNFQQILEVLNSLAKQYNLPVIVSTHPRTRKRIEEQNLIEINPLISFLKPFGFIDYIHLQMNSLCTISDSGTISEESAMLSFAAISLRQSMERPEAQDAGCIILTGFDQDMVLNSIKTSIDEFVLRDKYRQIPSEYCIENTSWRVLKLILGITKLSNKWDSINK
jgi:UDP-N-acetyl-L-fucosamine synthase